MKPLKKAEPVLDTKVKKFYHEHMSKEEVWMNDKYVVNVRRGLAMGEDGYKITHLSIRFTDRTKYLRDWREFQQIKNQLVGHHNWGFEIYPSEMHLVDGSNQFHMWVFEDKDLQPPFGFFDGRRISQSSFFGEVQRPFEDKPHDLEICEKKMQEEAEKLKQLSNDKYNNDGELD